MAIHPSAIKRHRQSLKKRAVNKEARSKLRTLIKKARQVIETKNGEQISAQLREVSRALGKAVSKGLLKKNTASRWLSRISRSSHRAAGAR
ncbi:MAG TPA: 30S ribosomal protein S20 [Candidatus Binatia bacterium]